MKYKKNYDAIFIMGPTASGKSPLALRIAALVGGEIINTDSCQLYHDLPILSALPAAADQADIPHHLYGALSSATNTNVADWCRMAEKCHQDIIQRQKIPLYVGGTGLYFKALQQGINEIPDVSSATKQLVEKRMQAEGAPAVHQFLKTIDPKIEERVHPNDTQRISRALAIYLETGTALDTYIQEQTMPPQIKQPFVIALNPPREDLNLRIEKRIDTMLQKDALAEVEQLRGHQADIAPGILALSLLKTIGFQELGRYIEGEITLAAAREKMIIATRKYAKRQRTWIRHQIAPDILLETLYDENMPLDFVQSLLR